MYRCGTFQYDSAVVVVVVPRVLVVVVGKTSYSTDILRYEYSTRRSSQSLGNEPIIFNYSTVL